MKVKVAILEKDQSYLNRIVAVFNSKYSDEFEVYSFTDLNMALNSVEATKIDVLVASDAFDIDVSGLPKKCGFAYFTDSSDVDTIKGCEAICKFQKVDLIYKQILNIYSEKGGNELKLKQGVGNGNVVVFLSPGGGTGSSVMAVAYSMRLAARGKRTLYLNLEQLGSSDIYFSGEGQYNMSDVIFMLKSRKANLGMKLESSVKQSQSGVYFFSGPKVALDMLELKGEDILCLISELRMSGSYDYIVLDMDFSLESERLKIYNMANAVVLVGDGSEISNAKIGAAYEAFATLEQNSDIAVLKNTSILYNKFSNKTSRTVAGIGLNEIGGARKYEYATLEQVISNLSGMEMLDKIC